VIGGCARCGDGLTETATSGVGDGSIPSDLLRGGAGAGHLMVNGSLAGA
jgi:hypothetical protein